MSVNASSCYLYFKLIRIIHIVKQHSVSGLMSMKVCIDKTVWLCFCCIYLVHHSNVVTNSPTDKSPLSLLQHTVPYEVLELITCNVMLNNIVLSGVFHTSHIIYYELECLNRLLSLFLFFSSQIIWSHCTALQKGSQ